MTAAELLDHEEALAIQRINESVQRLGDELCSAADLRRRIRRHPLLALGFGAVLGWVGGPLFPQVLKRTLSATSGVVLTRIIAGKLL